MKIARRFNAGFVVKELKFRRDDRNFRRPSGTWFFMEFVPALKCGAIVRGSFGTGVEAR